MYIYTNFIFFMVIRRESKTKTQTSCTIYIKQYHIKVISFRLNFELLSIDGTTVWYSNSTVQCTDYTIYKEWWNELWFSIYYFSLCNRLFLILLIDCNKPNLPKCGWYLYQKKITRIPSHVGEIFKTSEGTIAA